MSRLTKNISLLLLVLLISIASTGCRGNRTPDTPIHPNPNMDWQPKLKAQAYSGHIPDNTVAWGYQSINKDNASRDIFLKPETPFFTGKENKKWVSKIPMEVTLDFVKRGQERYNIYCAVCHTKTGNGTKSLISKKGWVVANILDDITYQRPDGELYGIITNGIRTMPGYRKQIIEEDRWAIVAYLRALQATQRGQLSDIPVSKRAELR